MRFLSPSRRVSSQDTRPPAPTAPRPPTREETIAELRAIYVHLQHRNIDEAKRALITLGQNLQA